MDLKISLLVLSNFIILGIHTNIKFKTPLFQAKKLFVGNNPLLRETLGGVLCLGYLCLSMNST